MQDREAMKRNIDWFVKWIQDSSLFIPITDYPLPAPSNKDGLCQPTAHPAV